MPYRLSSMLPTCRQLYLQRQIKLLPTLGSAVKMPFDGKGTHAGRTEGPEWHPDKQTKTAHYPPSYHTVRGGPKENIMKAEWPVIPIAGTSNRIQAQQS